MDEEKKGENIQTDPQPENSNNANPPQGEEESFFRKGKVDKFISPEDLNSLIQIIRPKEWVGLACLGMIDAFYSSGYLTDESLQMLSVVVLLCKRRVFSICTLNQRV